MNPRPISLMYIAGFLVLATLTGCGAVLNTGSYGSNYVMVVPTNAPYLIHPTGQYPSETPKYYRDVKYQPNYRVVDNMDQAIIDMRDKGYVMVGYSAVNTRERPDKPCGGLAGQDLSNCQLNYQLKTGLYYQDDPLGSPVEMAMYANADTVLVQKNYSFSRVEVQQQRIITDEGTNVTQSSGGSRNVYHDKWRNSTYGTSSTKGNSTSTGSSQQTGKEAHADIGASKLLGPSANVGGSLSQLDGTSKNKTKYDEQTNSKSTTVGGSYGGSSQDFDNQVAHTSKHWATALVDKHVDHYDMMATYWKMADPNKTILGALTEGVQRDLWEKLGTRTARTVIAVIGGSPAYLAEIWEGDILIAFDGEKIVGEAGLSKLLEKYNGQEVVLTLWRNGNFYDVTVLLNTKA
jgi:PDZ domain